MTTHDTTAPRHHRLADAIEHVGFRETLPATLGDDQSGARGSADELLRRAADCMPIGLVMFDANYELQVANTTFCELYGLDQQVVAPGLHLRDLIRIRQLEAGSSCGSIETKVKEV